jgi:hypothetical protein
MMDGFRRAVGLDEPLLGDEGGMAPAKESLKRIPVSERIQKTLEAAAGDQSDERVGACLKASAPVLGMAVRAVACVAPLFVWVYSRAYHLYSVAPRNVLRMTFGAALCGFGGTFAASFAAIEAVRQMGGERVYANVAVLLAEARTVQKASSQDDLLDEDHDGIADVDQIAPQALVQRKTLLAMRAVKEPARVEAAVGGLWAAYLAVLATLRLEFARTTAMALGLVETVELPLVRLLAPPIAGTLTAGGVAHWTQTVVTGAIKLVAIVLAWYLQMIISAFYSAMRGGRLFADGLSDFVLEHPQYVGYVEALPGVAKPFHPDTSQLDEVVGYGLAGLGFTYQLLVGFGLPFPLNVLFLPLELVEWFLRLQISMTASTDVSGHSG